MMSHERMMALIRGIYTAAADEARWPSVLESLADASGGGVAGFNYRVGVEGRVRSAQFARVDPALVNALQTYYSSRNPWTRLTQPLLRVGQVFALDALLPIADLRRTEFYAGILKPAGVLHALTSCVFRRNDDVFTFTAVRPPGKGPYQPDELSQVRDVLPHLQRAIQVNTRFRQLQRTRVALADALEYLRHGIIVVDARGTPMFANRAAREIAAARDGVTITASEIVASGRHDRLRLRALLAAAVRTGAGEGFDSGAAMTIARPSMKRPYLVLVAPLRLAPEPDASPGLATLFITDPEIQPDTPDTIPRRLFGLTPSEARVANALLVNGRLERAADQLGIGRETARWHLKRIYRKTGTTRQASLVRLLAGGGSRLRLDPAPHADALIVNE